jgi:hypothetical protein
MNGTHRVMRQPKPTFAHEVDSRPVLFRFAFRLIILTVFASLSTRGFGSAFVALLAMAALFCAIAGAMRREEMFGRVLTHWDEAVAYTVIARIASTLS